jgi:hypothetical protein
MAKEFKKFPSMPIASVSFFSRTIQTEIVSIEINRNPLNQPDPMM